MLFPVSIVRICVIYASVHGNTKPIRIEEFEQELAWWHNREESDAALGGLPLRARAWKVSGKQIKANGYNLDIKNPHKIDADQGDLEDMLAEYQQLLAELRHTRNTLKQELMNALRESGWV
jgi:type I restriction enzyme M protein